MKFRAICLIILFLNQGTCQDGVELKQKAVTRATNYGSSYFSSDQYIEMFDFVLDEIQSGKDASKVGSNAVTKMMSILTPEQYSEVMGFGATLVVALGLTGITGFFNKVSTVLANNMAAFFEQIQTKSVALKANGASDLEIDRQGYIMALEFLTPKRCETLICRVKKSFTPSQWSKMYNGLSKFLLITKYNDNEDCQF
uniref:Secreted protein n=1 Tax=Rhabditophanes sp. KR3021 TaxID=114890 RepID=A0AC35TJF7_9BILA